MKALFAFDKFKGSLSAQEACRLASNGICDDIEIEITPLSDGGEGFCEIVTNALGGVLRNYPVTYPEFDQGEAIVGYVDLATTRDDVLQNLSFPNSGLLAIIEMAQGAGHHLIKEQPRNPWKYSSMGVGELIRYASAEGATSALIGVGGSATNDMGLGLLEALGMEGFDSDGNPISPIIPVSWNSIQKISIPEETLDLEVRIACDVNNPLHGPNGSAVVFGPQKGLLESDSLEMRQQMEALASLLCSTYGKDPKIQDEAGMGAAGGLPFSLALEFDAKLVSGFETMATILDLDEKIQAADVVVTGEGRFDESSLEGKGPYSIAKRAIELGKKACIISGKVEDAARNSLRETTVNLEIIQLGDPGSSVDENIRAEKQRLIDKCADYFSTIYP